MIKHFQLGNQSQVILAPRQETEAATLLVGFRVGSRHEQEATNGISHFIEHLFFKGSKKRPNTRVISQELDGVGANFNAFTSKERTAYYIKIPKQKLELAFDILSDMLFAGLFKKSEIERERGVIIEEIKMYEDTPIYHIETILEMAVYEGHPLARDIAGPIKNIATLSRQEILAYKKRYYRADNMFIAVAGNFSEKKVRQWLRQYFDRSFGKHPEIVTDKNFAIDQAQSRVKLQFKQTDQSQLAIGFPAVGEIDPKYYHQLLLANILGGNMSSRLFTSVRERRGLAYTVRASLDEHPDVTNFCIRAGVANTKIEEAYKVIMSELRKMKKELVPKAELTKAKENLKGRLALALEDSEDQASWLMHLLMTRGHLATVAEVREKIDAVTAAQIKKAAHEIFRPDRLSLAVIGPFKSKQKFQKLATQTKI
ncbi:MAG: insulinase family protein [Candidatus Komeilibacteria bacterium]|nr:insulinase family protein [Candidatus Komeilibacteria bacterium]